MMLVTFDCYGTLIDLEGGRRAALARLVAGRGLDVEPDALVARYIAVEMKVEAEPYRPYRQVLRVALARTFEEQGVTLDEDRRSAFASSIEEWEPFPEVGPALRSLRDAGHRLAILSNVDDDIVERSIERIGVQFDWIVTAEQVRSYKPAPGHWERILELTAAARAGAEPRRERGAGGAGGRRSGILHVAASLEHDIRPATALGLNCVWINRKGEPVPSGPGRPQLVLEDLAALPRYVQSL